jgi:hypothetical protein
LEQALIWIQAIACIPMILSVYLAHKALKVADYAAPDGEDSWRDDTLAGTEIDGVDPWVDRQRARLTWAILLSTRERCAAIEGVNESRLKFLTPARGCLFAAMILNSLALAIIAIIRLF